MENVQLSAQFPRRSPGVPQVSVIGPALFLVYVNDLPNGIKPKVRLFADTDSIIYLTINNSDDFQQLQHDLTVLQKWRKECEILRVSRVLTQIAYTCVLRLKRLTTLFSLASTFQKI